MNKLSEVERLRLENAKLREALELIARNDVYAECVGRLKAIARDALGLAMSLAMPAESQPINWVAETYKGLGVPKEIFEGKENLYRPGTKEGWAKMADEVVRDSTCDCPVIVVSDLRGAVARGWCHKANEHKVMDPDLAEAIVEEVYKLLPDAITNVCVAAPTKGESDGTHE